VLIQEGLTQKRRKIEQKEGINKEKVGFERTDEGALILE